MDYPAKNYEAFKKAEKAMLNAWNTVGGYKPPYKSRDWKKVCTQLNAYMRAAVEEAYGTANAVNRDELWNVAQEWADAGDHVASINMVVAYDRLSVLAVNNAPSNLR